jgi:hypothetical protein
MHAFMKQHSRITPRLIRFRDVPRYLGMDHNRLNAEVRPYLVEIRIGRQAIPSHAYGQNGKAFLIVSREACTIIPPNQWAKQVEILVRDGIPGCLEMPCSPELQGID